MQSYANKGVELQLSAQINPTTKPRHAFLFIEDEECENTKTIDRIFYHLRQIGAFKVIKGMVVGRFPRCVGFSNSDSLEMILNDALRGYDFPVLTEVDFGHTDPLLTLPIGVRCHLDADRKKIELIEAAVQSPNNIDCK